MTRRIFVRIALCLAAANCSDAAAGATPTTVAGDLLLQASPSPFTQVTAGPVQGLIPDRWRAAPLPGAFQEGFVASPRLRAWSMDGSAEGIAAMWVDATEIGVPSDYYYLAATGSSVGRLAGSAECRSRLHVIVDHRPSYMEGGKGSPGDYLAKGTGVCVVDGEPTRFAFFVAAPGYGPIRSIGIPTSGLYVTVAVVDGDRSTPWLRRLMFHTRFGGADLSDFIAAARA